MRANSTQPRAFTLMELLVVIAIIALLMSILGPSLTRVKELARRTRCRANFHSVGISFGIYASDSNGKFPPQFCALGTPDKDIRKTPMFIVDTFYRMLKDTYGYEPGVLTCPSWCGDSIWVSTSDSPPYYSNDLFGAGKLPNESTQDLRYVTWNNQHWPDGRLMGVFFLHSLWYDNDTPVPTSPHKPSDPGEKILASDMNMYWESPTQIWSAHYEKKPGRLPAGANRLHLDGSAIWVGNNVMAQDDQPLTVNAAGVWQGRYRFSHWSGVLRRYYW